MTCQCGQNNTVSAVVDGVYYPEICKSCLASISSVSISSGLQGYNRRRDYEDNAQDTVQPYDAGGNPRPEFYRLYPSQAEKVFTKSEIEQVKRKL
jgi:hypothetical protein